MTKNSRFGALFACGLLIALPLGAALPTHGVQPSDREQRLRAEFVERFTRFIEWPSGAMPLLGAPFVIGVLSDTLFQSYLEQMARERSIQGRDVAVRRLTTIAGSSSCHLLWIPRCSEEELAEILDVTATLPILMVGESEGLAARGVHINLKREGPKLRFEINLEAATKSRLKLKPNLLRLGIIVAPKSNR